jgi:hypothetical protein
MAPDAGPGVTARKEVTSHEVLAEADSARHPRGGCGGLADRQIPRDRKGRPETRSQQQESKSAEPTRQLEERRPGPAIRNLR